MSDLTPPSAPSDGRKVPDDADQMTSILCRVIDEALEIEGWDFDVYLVGEQEIRIVGYGRRFGLKVVRKRA